MTNTIEELDFLIAHCLALYRTPIRHFGRSDAGAFLNTPIPFNVENEVICENIYKMANNGLIIASSIKKGYFSPSFEEILHLMENSHKIESISNEIFLSLTALGGDFWEERATPCWSMFIKDCFNYNRMQYSSVEVINEELANKIIYLLPKKTRDSTRNKIKKISPWRATYWKILPSGLKIYFKKINSHELEKLIQETRESWVKFLK
ncbi:MULTISPECIES: hypothetical protein [unclassified Serratia (in: enterobacteria)]|uniref:hypothetical protein n=1 Tax=unclassified Serratia (in: enterobacteria) TaxID=2647522 RepID=UPI00307668F6